MPQRRKLHKKPSPSDRRPNQTDSVADGFYNSHNTRHADYRNAVAENVDHVNTDYFGSDVYVRDNLLNQRQETTKEMNYEVTLTCDSEDHAAVLDLVEIISQIAAYMVDNVEVLITKGNE